MSVHAVENATDRVSGTSNDMRPPLWRIETAGPDITTSLVGVGCGECGPPLVGDVLLLSDLDDELLYGLTREDRQYCEEFCKRVPHMSPDAIPVRADEQLYQMQDCAPRGAATPTLTEVLSAPAMMDPHGRQRDGKSSDRFAPPRRGVLTRSASRLSPVQPSGSGRWSCLTEQPRCRGYTRT